jgi:hypothetical protein
VVTDWIESSYWEQTWQTSANSYFKSPEPAIHLFFEPEKTTDYISSFEDKKVQTPNSLGIGSSVTTCQNRYKVELALRSTNR